MGALEQHIRTEGWTEAEAADRLAIPRPSISDLMHGRITLFSIDMMVTLLSRAGLHVDILVREAA
ncbi:XRE family transcriptional regulator [Rhizobium sp. DKSPLA3]|uniref:XRE family transcriptional regulator n=2 Tax=Rhizobium quercicola TaxID=2901226 RepID=A0A9X1T067_9HYPH|nr:XRE family transcriptional regulator [Rhizobium quercicola]